MKSINSVSPVFQPTVIKHIAALTRGLILDASFYSETGHLGVPMACAEIVSYLYGHFLQFRIAEPWLARDRFILSSGHAALAQYACLHMVGYSIELDALKSHTSIGIEASTGADGQGIAYAVGNALGIKRLSSKLPTHQQSLFSNKIITLAGDGCLMEGISYEASALAGHWKLNNLIVIFRKY